MFYVQIHDCIFYVPAALSLYFRRRWTPDLKLLRRDPPKASYRELPKTEASRPLSRHSCICVFVLKRKKIWPGDHIFYTPQFERKKYGPRAICFYIHIDGLQFETKKSGPRTIFFTIKLMIMSLLTFYCLLALLIRQRRAIC